MVKVIMHGCNGKMGRIITRLVEGMEDIEIVAGIDALDSVVVNKYPVYRNINLCGVKADVIIDFAVAGALDMLLDYALTNKTPIVLCTTGLNEEQIKRVEDASKKIPILRSANMSLGINLLMKLVRDAARTLEPAGFDIELVEKHHNQKLDAPSGTALALADSINDELGNKYNYVYDRSQRRQARDSKEIGISAVRGGTIVGDHDVIFAGEDEVITISHSAYSRAVFGKGAIAAAKFLAGKEPGLYTMSDVIG